MGAVAVSGIGSVSCVGIGADALWKSAVEGRSGIVGGLGWIPENDIHHLKTLFPDAHQLSRSVLIAYAAITEALQHAGWSGLSDDDGLIIATTAGQISFWEDELIRFLHKEIAAPEFAKSIRHQSLGSVVEVVAKLMGFRGRTMLVSSACSAATQAIGLGALWVEQGTVRRCLVGGTEVLSKLTLEGFRSLQLLSPEVSMPFDENRAGINLSEGAAFLCLEADAQRALARVTGCGFSTDAYHMASPHPEGKGCYTAMKGALDRAGIEPAAVSWVHAHGTASRANDSAEGNAISQLFGKPGPWVSSTKGIHGHALGASGAVEAVLCVQALRHQIVPATHGLKNPDATIPVRHPEKTMSFELRHVLKNTLGFGGNNAAIVLSKGAGR